MDAPMIWCPGSVITKEYRCKRCVKHNVGHTTSPYLSFTDCPARFGLPITQVQLLYGLSIPVRDLGDQGCCNEALCVNGPWTGPLQVGAPHWPLRGSKCADVAQVCSAIACAVPNCTGQPKGKKKKVCQRSKGEETKGANGWGACGGQRPST